jgi:membrane protein
VVFTGPLARRADDVIGLGDTALIVWSIAKWPVLVVLVILMIAILCWASPNAKVRGFKWVTPGSGPDVSAAFAAFLSAAP